MKKIILFALVLIAIMFFWHGWTSLYFGSTSMQNTTINKDVSVFGGLKASKAAFEGLSIHGSAEISKSNIKNSLIVKGKLQLDESKVGGSLEVDGRANLKDFSVDGPTVINGSLTAKNGTFNGPLTLASKKVQLAGTTLNKNIVMRRHKKEQVLELLQGTVIKGSITFQSGKGVIIKEPGVVVEGKIEGAEVREHIGSKEKEGSRS